MLDRKSWIVLLLCGGLLALNIYYKGKLERERAAQAPPVTETEPETETGDGEPAKTDPAGGGEDTANPSISGEKPAVDSAPEELIELRTARAVFELSTHGGGIKRVDMLGQRGVGANSDVFLNRHGKKVIGALTTGADRYENGIYKIQSRTERDVVFQAEIGDEIYVQKRWALVDPEEQGSAFRLSLEVTLENQGDQAVQLADYGLFVGTAAPLHAREWENQTGLFYMDGGDFEFEAVTWFKKGFMREARPLLDRAVVGLGYAGVSNQFFSTVVMPKEPYAGKVWGKISPVKLPEAAGGKDVKVVRAGMSLPEEELAGNGGQKVVQFDVLTGPKENLMLRGLDGKRGKVMNYGLFGFVSWPLNLILNKIHTHVFAPISDKWSWGFSIILLTILIRGAMWPLQNKSTRSMKRMSKLQPQVATLREKYPDDPQKMNSEMMKLYREYGVNPLGGCLPLVVQIPIFFGFYRMLQYAVELRQQEFLWVGDLSQPDTLWTIPIMGGVPLNLLPILMAGTMVLQMSLTPKTGDKMQQRMFMFMPLIFFFFCYNFASALALYWTTSNIFAIVQMLITQRLPEAELKKKSKGPGWMARMQARAEEMQKQKGGGGSPGGAPGSTPKKPKKPRGPRTGG